MGLVHNLKARLGPARSKVSDLAQQHGDTIAHGLDKAAKAVDDKTGHKYSGRIRTGTGKAKEAVDRLAHHGTGDAGGTGTRGAGDSAPTTPPAGPPPAS